MKLFPEKEQRKKFMKGGLPVVLAVAWTPIVWMTLASFLGPVMERMFGAWQVTVVILGAATLMVMITLIRLFKIAGSRIVEKTD